MKKKLGIWLHKNVDSADSYLGWEVQLGDTNDKFEAISIGGREPETFLDDAVDLAEEVSKMLDIPFLGVFDIGISETEFQPVNDYKMIE